MAYELIFRHKLSLLTTNLHVEFNGRPLYQIFRRTYFYFIHSQVVKQKHIVLERCHRSNNIMYLLMMCAFLRVPYSVDNLLGNVKILNDSSVCLTPLNKVYSS